MRVRGVFQENYYGDRWEWRLGLIIACGILAFLTVVGGGIAGGIVWTTDAKYHFAVQGCRHWSESVNRPAHEVRYTWGTWDCLTPNPAVPGTYIPSSKLFLVNK